MSEERRKKMEKSIAQRAIIRGLTVDYKKLEYFVKEFFNPIDLPQNAKALFVGLGHGHDAVLALAETTLSTIVGVDPFIENHGNGVSDHDELINLVNELGLSEKIEIKKMHVQEYLRDCVEKFDVIVCADVLHHIFVTPLSLNKSECAREAEELFKSFHSVLNRDGRLLISETSRHGLRPFLAKRNVLKTEVDYTTKQDFSEWVICASNAAWNLERVSNYVPYQLRNFSRYFPDNWARYTYCDRYFIEFSHD